MTTRVGTLAKDSFRLTDTSGAAIDGILNASTRWTTKTAVMVGTGTSYTLTIAGTGNGRYEATFTPTEAGDVEVTVEYDDGAGVVARFWGSEVVEPNVPFDTSLLAPGAVVVEDDATGILVVVS